MCVVSVLVALSKSGCSWIEHACPLHVSNEKPADHLSGLCSWSHWAWWGGTAYKPPVFLLLKQAVWPLRRESKTLLFKAGSLGGSFCFCLFFFFLYLLSKESSISTLWSSLLPFVMASSQMHCRWTQQSHSPKHIWIMTFQIFQCNWCWSNKSHNRLLYSMAHFG